MAFFLMIISNFFIIHEESIKWSIMAIQSNSNIPKWQFTIISCYFSILDNFLVDNSKAYILNLDMKIKKNLKNILFFKNIS